MTEYFIHCEHCQQKPKLACRLEGTSLISYEDCLDFLISHTIECGPKFIKIVSTEINNKDLSEKQQLTR